ncbi:hypothetical protein HK405_008855 [Cladochytrium tenue]|nr:hypothetical protein HK405_008855 [Cladochytrium tenue]
MPTADDAGGNGPAPAPAYTGPTSDRVFVTLVTSDAYVPGALALAHSLRSHRRPSINSTDATAAAIPIVVLVTPTSLSSASSAALYRAFDRLVHVPTFRSGAAPGDAAGLRALARPELDITFTKLHVWDPDILGRHVRAFAFLDADAFAVPDGPDPAALFDLLDRDDAHFAAAPDVGWPDAFNSGVFVGRPDRAVFDALLWHARHLGSFDGGDQGLLNAFFSSWAGHGRSPSGSVPPGVVVPAGVPQCPQVGPLRATRLPFSFNVTPSAAYSYLPAYSRFRSDISIVHFAGTIKPWNLTRFADGTVMNHNMPNDAVTLYNLWWAVYDSYMAQIKAEDAQDRAIKESSPYLMHSVSTGSGNHAVDARYSSHSSEIEAILSSSIKQNQHYYFTPSTSQKGAEYSENVNAGTSHTSHIPSNLYARYGWSGLESAPTLLTADADELPIYMGAWGEFSPTKDALTQINQSPQAKDNARAGRRSKNQLQDIYSLQDYEIGLIGGLAGEYYFGNEPNFGITINPLALRHGKKSAAVVKKPAKTPSRHVAPPQPQEVQQGHNQDDLSEVVLDAIAREAPQTLQNGGRLEVGDPTPMADVDTLIVDSASVTATLKRKVVTRVAVSARTTRTTTTTVRETVTSGRTVVGEHAAVVTTTSTTGFVRVLPSSAAPSDSHEVVGGSRTAFTKSNDTVIAPSERPPSPLFRDAHIDTSSFETHNIDAPPRHLRPATAKSLTDLRSSSWRSSELPSPTGIALDGGGIGVAAALLHQSSGFQRRLSSTATSPLVVQRGVVPANRGYSSSDAESGGGVGSPGRPRGRRGPGAGISTSEDDLAARSAAVTARRSLPATPVPLASFAMKLHPLGTAAFATIGTRAAPLPQQQLSPTTRLGLAAAAAAAATNPGPAGLAGILSAAHITPRWNSATTSGSASASAAARRASSHASTAVDRDAGPAFDDDDEDDGVDDVDDVERSSSNHSAGLGHYDKPAPPVRFKGSADRLDGSARYADPSASTLALAAPADEDNDDDDGTT